VKFYASLGNHDDPNIERLYKYFNMDGKRYYSFHKGNIDFFVLDSNYMTVEQTNWLREELPKSKATWKICYFHHPLYSDAKFHGSDVDLRNRIEPIFRKAGVDVVLSGHEHVYERLVPQYGINYFVLGNSGELRFHDLKTSQQQMAKGFDTDRDFGAFEVAGNEFYFQIISRTGQTVDNGMIAHREPAAHQ
jgi:predicted phosphodiesterase